MKLLLATALLTLAVCVAALGCGSDSESTTVQNADVPGTFFGVVPQGALTTDDLNRMGVGKVGTLRVVLPWHDLDATAKPGDTDLATIDPVVLDAARNGIQVVPTIFSTPDWVAAGLDGRDCAPACATYAPHSEAALAAWKGFVGDMVARYGPGGEFWETHPEVAPIPVRTWQIWNEQNSPTFFQPAPDPSAYAKLLSTAAESIRKHDPGAQILLGGMFQTNGTNGTMLADKFLQQLYAINGARDDFDGVASHPYAHDVARVEGQVRALHDEVVRAGDDASLWVTEIGASSADGANPLELGEEGQADLLRDAFTFFLSKRTEWNIQSVIWYSWRDTSADPPVCDWCANSGLFPEASLDPKPAWAAFTSFTGGT